MEKIINFFNELKKEDVPLVGGKGANLGEMMSAKIPVPEGFVVNIYAYKEFLNQKIDNVTLKEKISEILSKTDFYDNSSLEENTKKIRDLIMSTPMPKEISEKIKEAYRKLCNNKDDFVAVRSSATAEDIPEASFAGQQDTYLNVIGEDNVVFHVQKCWASLFTARATFYRQEKKFDHMQTYLAVVVQKMVNPEVSGVMFCSDPITGEEKMIIEAAYGLGEAVVGGKVTPDTYIIDKKSMKIIDKKISVQKIGIIRKNGKTVEAEINPNYQNRQKMSDEEILNLANVGILIENHYKQPMDVEWCMENGKVYIVQARPITTIKKDKKIEQKEEVKERKILIKGLAASPGIGKGVVKIIKDISELSNINEGDILVTTMTTPDMVPAMRRASAIVTDEGGMTCHAAIVSRELQIPCIVGTKNATKILKNGDKVTVDGNKGVVYEGYIELEKKKEVVVSEHPEKIIEYQPIITATEVKANVDFGYVAERAKKLGADGVGLLRAEHMFLEIGEHPSKLIKEGRREELIRKIMDGIRSVAEVMYPNPVWYRTLDLKTDEFRSMKGGENEPIEANPMIGWRGIRRSIDEVEIIKCEFEAIKRLREEERLTNIGIMLPMVQHVSELKRAKELAAEVGLNVNNMDFGIMVEIPAAALTIEDFIKEGISFISFGTNDLTQFTLALDRNSAHVAKLYNEQHPAVLKLIKYVIKKCKKANVKTSVCGQAGSDPKMVELLIKMGIDSVSANVDAIPTIRAVCARVESKLLLESARKNFIK